MARFLNLPVRKLIENPRKILLPYVNEGDTAIDLGCGGGFFTVELAKLVGSSGKVIAVDFQPEMLELTRRFASRKKVADRITVHHCDQDDIMLTGQTADVVIAMHIVHETPDPERFLRQVSELVHPGGYLLVSEPKGHAEKESFVIIRNRCEQYGLTVLEEKTTPRGWSIVLQRPG